MTHPYVDVEDPACYCVDILCPYNKDACTACGHIIGTLKLFAGSPRLDDYCLKMAKVVGRAGLTGLACLRHDDAFAALFDRAQDGQVEALEASFVCHSKEAHHNNQLPPTWWLKVRDGTGDEEVIAKRCFEHSCEFSEQTDQWCWDDAETRLPHLFMVKERYPTMHSTWCFGNAGWADFKFQVAAEVNHFWKAGHIDGQKHPDDTDKLITKGREGRELQRRQGARSREY